MLTYVIHTSTSFRQLALREKFLAAIVPGSAVVYSLTPAAAVPVGAFIVDGILHIDAAPSAQLNLTIVVAGVNRNFPDWDMPARTDEERERAERFWGGARRN
jgi:hypothetical protein